MVVVYTARFERWPDYICMSQHYTTSSVLFGEVVVNHGGCTCSVQLALRGGLIIHGSILCL